MAQKKSCMLWILLILIVAGATPLVLNYLKGTQKGLALFDAIRSDNEAEVKRLLDSGVSASSRDIDGQPAIHVAVSRKNSRILELLLQRGADVKAKDAHGRTALRFATEHNDPLSEKALQAHGATE